VRARLAEHGVGVVACVPDLSRSSHGMRLGRGPSRRARADAGLVGAAERVRTVSRGAGGGPCATAGPRRGGRQASRDRVARLMAGRGLRWVARWRIASAARHGTGRPAPGRGERCFEADAPDRLRVAGFDCVPAQRGWLYLAVVLGVYGRGVRSRRLRPRGPFSAFMAAESSAGPWTHVCAPSWSWLRSA
jgi:hypothetical protein